MGDGTFTAGTALALTSPYGLAAGDIDGDGNADLIGVSNYGNHALFLSKGDGTFKTGIPFYGPGEWSSETSTAMAAPDIVVANTFDTADVDGNRTTSVFLGSGDSMAPLQYDNMSASTNVFRDGPFPMNPVLTDFDGNGRLDIVTVNEQIADSFTILFNTTM